MSFVWPRWSGNPTPSFCSSDFDNSHDPDWDGGGTYPSPPPWLRYCGSACRRHWSIVQHSVWWANVGGVMLSADKLIRRPAAVLDCSTFFQDRISLPVAHLPSLTSKLTAEHFALMATFSFWCFEFWRLSRSYNCTDKILTAEFGLVQCFPYSGLQTILQFTFWQIFAKGIAVLFVSTAVINNPAGDLCSENFSASFSLNCDCC